MKKISFNKAKSLSEKKWKHIVENNGQITDSLYTEIPALKTFFCDCPMCHYRFEVLNKNCDNCIYEFICTENFQKWYDNKTKENAELIYNNIKIANFNNQK